MVSSVCIITLLCLFNGVTGRHAGNFVEIQRHFDFEHVLQEDQDAFWVWRSEASDLKTLRLVDFNAEYRVEVLVCIEPIEGDEHVILTLDDIRYANDGPSDTIYVTLDGEAWAEYRTFEKWAYGHEWNIFRNTGRIGNSAVLSRGLHVIEVSVRTDKYGLELDRIRLNAEYQRLNSTLFCGGSLRHQVQSIEN